MWSMMPSLRRIDASKRSSRNPISCAAPEAASATAYWSLTSTYTPESDGTIRRPHEIMGDSCSRALTQADFTPTQADAITDAVRLAAEHGDHVTRDQFKAGNAEVRTEIAGLDTRLSTQIANLDTRLSTQIANLDTRVSTQIANLETRLVRWDDRHRAHDRRAGRRNPPLARLAWLARLARLAEEPRLVACLLGSGKSPKLNLQRNLARGSKPLRTCPPSPTASCSITAIALYHPRGTSSATYRERTLSPNVDVVASRHDVRGGSLPPNAVTGHRDRRAPSSSAAALPIL